MKPRKFNLILLVGVVAGSLSAVAQDRASAALDSLPSIKKIDQVAMSPDGAQVAYIVGGELSVVTLADGATHRIGSEGKLAAQEVTWSTDSSRVAWLADLPGDVPAAELWVAGADGSGAAKLADLKGYAQTPRFAPDGSKVAVLFIEGITGGWPLAADDAAERGGGGKDL